MPPLRGPARRAVRALLLVAAALLAPAASAAAAPPLTFGITPAGEAGALGPTVPPVPDKTRPGRWPRCSACARTARRSCCGSTASSGPRDRRAPGQSFTATLASPLTVEGRTVIPAGAAAAGTVVDAKPLGRFKGGAVLQLRLTSITVNGSEQSISTSSVTRTETGKGKRTAVLAGGGAGLGALIGGLAGGGKGAAIGALAGGGAGTGGAAFTGNKDVVLPAESALSFKLEQPLEVK